MKQSFKKSFMFILTILALTFSAFGVTPAYAAAVDLSNNLAKNGASDGAAYVSITQYPAQAFTTSATNSKITSVSLALCQPWGGGVTGTYSVEIWDATGADGAPGTKVADIDTSGNALSLSTVVNYAPSMSCTPVTYSGLSIVLSPSTNYYLVARGVSLSDNLFWLATSNATGTGFPSNSSTYTGSWGSPDQYVPMIMQVSADTASAMAITVTSNTDSGAGSLRQAIADIDAGGTITFDASLNGTPISLASTLTIGKDITIQGNGVGNTIIQPSSSNIRHFYITAGNLTLDGMTLQNGSCMGGCAYPSGSYGGAILNWNSSSNLTILNSFLTNNHTNSNAAAVLSKGPLVIRNSTFSNNVADYPGAGGAILANSNLDISNSTFYGNSGGYLAGTIIASGPVSITNSTLANNSGAVAIYSSNASFTLTNNIIANNSGGDCFTSTSVVGNNNLIKNGSSACGLTNGVNGNIIGVDPLLNTLGNNGGTTKTMSLQTDSPALGAGNASACAAAPINGLDQRGETRPQGNSVCDIGAFESSISLVICSSSITVTSVADSGAGSLRQAIADVCDGGTITFDNNYAIQLTSGELAVDKALTIDGSGHDVVLDGNNSSRVINASGAITLTNLTIQNGANVVTGGGLDAAAGATLDNVYFLNNKVTLQGGAARILGGATITNSTFKGNQTTVADPNDFGGALTLNDGGTIDNSTFDTNTSASYAGAVSNNPYAASTVTITNSTFTGNAGNVGADIVAWKPMNISNSTFNGSTVNQTGGGALALAAATSLVNVTIAHSSDTGIQGSGPVNMTNSIIAYTVTGSDCTATLGTNDNNLIEDGSCSPAVSGDPKLDILAFNGGDTKTMALLSSSPAIDAGNNTTCATAPIDNADQRGVTRPQGAACDIGAYEFSPKAITAFDFADPSATTKIDEASHIITVSVPKGTGVWAMVPTFTFEGASVEVGGVAQASGVTENDFTSPVIYTVTATDGSTQDYTVAVTVSPLTTVPVLLSPANGTLVTSFMPTLDWADSSQIMDLSVSGWHYEIHVSAPFGAYDQTFDTADDADAAVGLSASQYTFASPLPANTTFSWRVRSYNDANQYSPWSAARTFRTMLETPTLNLPENSTFPALDNNRPTFSWNAVEDATTYTLQILKAGKVVNTGTIKVPALSYTPTVDLLVNTTYTWQVKANGTSIASNYSLPYTFTTSYTTPPAIPVLTAPAINALVNGSANVKFDWNPVLVTAKTPAAASFELGLSWRSDFTGPASWNYTVDDNTALGTQLTLAPFAPGRTFYWRVRSWSGLGNTGTHSAWSVVRTFNVKFVAPVLVSPVSANGVGTRPTFKWSSAGNGLWTNYTLQVADNSTFTKGLRSFTITAPVTSYTIPSNLPGLTPGLKYWRVKINGIYSPIFSSYNTFTVTIP